MVDATIIRIHESRRKLHVHETLKLLQHNSVNIMYQPVERPLLLSSDTKSIPTQITFYETNKSFNTGKEVVIEDRTVKHSDQSLFRNVASPGWLSSSKDGGLIRKVSSNFKPTFYWCTVFRQPDLA